VTRFIVTEIEGDLGPGSHRGKNPPGISCHVLDTLWNYKLLGTFRSEDPEAGPSQAAHPNLNRTGMGRNAARERAQELADRLNGG
jgi:hypothetical protein